MNKTSVSRSLIVAGVCVSAAIIIGEVISSCSYIRAITSLAEPRQITVTGNAAMTVKSDLAIWNGIVSRKGTAIDEKAMTRIKSEVESDSARLKGYFLTRGMKGDEIISGPVTLSVTTDRDDDGYENVSGYVIWRKIELRSDTPEKIAAIANDAGAILSLGIHCENETASYVYTKQNDLRLKMFASAAENAKAMAQRLAAKNGNEIKYMSEVQTGVFQIIAADSREPYEESADDTTSISKKAVATVTAVFQLK